MQNSIKQILKKRKTKIITFINYFCKYLYLYLYLKTYLFLKIFLMTIVLLLHVKIICRTIVTKIFFVWQISSFINIFYLTLHAIQVHGRIVGNIYSKRTISVRPLTEDFQAYIVNKQVAICLQSSFVLFVILSIRGHGKRKKK